MLSQTAEYALRAVVCLAQNPSHPLTTQEIARLTQVPASYLSKVLQALGRSNVVQSSRGIYGGFILTVPAAELTILRVINAVDPIKRIVRCPLSVESHGKALCPLHRRLDEAAALIEKDYARTTISELLSDPSQSTPLCSVTTNARTAHVGCRGPTLPRSIPA